MRCPYCGGLNRDQSTFCVNCGRDMTRQMPNPNAQQPQWPPAAPQARPTHAPNQQGRPQQSHLSAPPQPRPTPQPQPSNRRQPVAPVPAPVEVVAPPAPEAPAPFPPRTMAHLNALLSAGAQAYTVVESSIGVGRKKLVRIAYQRCTGWQQAATLLKALNEQQEEQCNTIIIQGVLPQQQDVYAFTNGQLEFDRAVRLGGQTSNRYVIETDNGYESDSVRFVLNE